MYVRMISLPIPSEQIKKKRREKVMAKKRNWDRIQERAPQDTMQYRDVYEDQQLERSKIEEMQSPTSRTVVAVVVAVIAAIFAYLIACMFSFCVASIQNLGSGISGNTTTESSTSSGGSDAQSSNQSYSSANEYAEANGFTSKIIYPDGKYPVLGWVDESGNEYTTEQMYDIWMASLGSSNSSVTSESTGTESGTTESNTSDDTSTEVSSTSEETADTSSSNGIATYFLPTWGKVLFALVVGLVVYSLLHAVLMRNLKSQNLMNDTSDINQYQNDQHIALPEEIQRKFDYFPDVGAHSNVQFSSMISHMALSNKGLKKIQVARRADKDIVDEDGDIVYYKGEVLLDENGDILYDTKPLMDKDFMEALFDASGLPKDKQLRKYYDTTQIPYNPDGSNRDKLGKYATVADLINDDWTFPSYEPQRPAGVYIVDTAPVNTINICMA